MYYLGQESDITSYTKHFLQLLKEYYSDIYKDTSIQSADRGGRKCDFIIYRGKNNEFQHNATLMMLDSIVNGKKDCAARYVDSVTSGHAFNPDISSIRSKIMVKLVNSEYYALHYPEAFETKIKNTEFTVVFVVLDQDRQVILDEFDIRILSAGNTQELIQTAYKNTMESIDFRMYSSASPQSVHKGHAGYRFTASDPEDFSATALLFQAKYLCERLHTSIFIFPWTTRLAFAIPGKVNKKEIIGIHKWIMEEVRKKYVAECDRLSDNIYVYDEKSGLHLVEYRA